MSKIANRKKPWRWREWPPRLPEPTSQPTDNPPEPMPKVPWKRSLTGTQRLMALGQGPRGASWPRGADARSAAVLSESLPQQGCGRFRPGPVVPQPGHSQGSCRRSQNPAKWYKGRWSEPVMFAEGCTLNKPSVLANGDWLLPVSDWRKKTARVFASTDAGKTWRGRGPSFGFPGAGSQGPGSFGGGDTSHHFRDFPPPPQKKPGGVRFGDRRQDRNEKHDYHRNLSDDGLYGFCCRHGQDTGVLGDVDRYKHAFRLHPDDSTRPLVRWDHLGGARARKVDGRKQRFSPYRERATAQPRGAGRCGNDGPTGHRVSGRNHHHLS